MTDIFGMKGKKVAVLGHTGMLGQALVKRLEQEDCILQKASSGECNFFKRSEVDKWFSENQPDYVFCCAALVGGIQDNINRPAEFLYCNVIMSFNIILACMDCHAGQGVDKLLYFGSSCMYPKDCDQPMKETDLLTGPFEPTNEGYAIAKTSATKLIEYCRQSGHNFISCIPCTLYGPNDNYDLESSHAMAAIIQKICDAKEHNQDTVKLWGTGAPKREFLHIDDCADAAVYLMKYFSEDDPINVGFGKDISIYELAKMVKRIAKYEGSIIYNNTITLDGMMRKLLDTSKLNSFGWHPTISLEEGITETITERINTT